MSDRSGQRDPASLQWDYWKIELPGNMKAIRAALIQNKYLVKASESDDGLIYHYSRLQRGLMSYDTCTDDELRKFCKERLRLPTIPLCDRDNLIEVLENLDEKKTLESWDQLAPELRKLIIEFHIDSMPTTQATRTWLRPPPITEVSKSTHRESLAVFYKNSEVEIEHNLWSGAAGIQPTPYTAYQLQSLGEECLGYIRKFHLRGIGFNPQPQKFEFQIEITARNVAYEVKKMDGGAKHSGSSEQKLVIDRMEAGLRNWLEEISVQKGEVVLSGQDIGDLNGVWAATVQGMGKKKK